MSQSISNKLRGTIPKPTPKQSITQELDTKEKPMISRLINSAYYFIQFVFILQINDTDSFRLVALNQGNVLIDKHFPTVRGCRIAFQKTFKDKACSSDIKPEWSVFYNPDKQWLEKKYKYLQH